jgi:hypothetical protein
MYARVISVFLLLAAVLLCPVLAAADDFGGAPDLAGFRGMKWGANRTDFAGLALMNDDPIIHRYTRRNDQLQLGGVELESIIYNFYKGRFMGVSIEARGAGEWNRLKVMMFDKFGPAPNISAKKSAEQYEWRAARSTTHLQYFKNSRRVKLWIVSAEFSGLKGKGR